jgi:KDO2-lipid IV(A) lauroyltransferase
MARAEGNKAAFNLRHYIQHLALRTLIGIPMALPYRLRVPVFGWIAARLIAPVAGWHRRVRENLARIPSRPWNGRCPTTPDAP